MNRKEDIRKELEEIAPFLAKLDNKMAFKVPKGYFEELPDNVLETVSPLAALKQKQAFKVPANYFESLPDLVLERVKPQEEPEVAASPSVEKTPNWLDELINSVALLFQPRYAMRLAAVALVLTGGLYFFSNQGSTGIIAQAEADPLEEYGLALDDLNDDDLTLLLSEASSEELPASSEDIDQLLDHMLENIDDINDEDLESLL